MDYLMHVYQENYKVGKVTFLATQNWGGGALSDITETLGGP